MAVVVYSVNPYLALLDKSNGSSDILFAFNGVDQYATFPAWTPLGLPFTIKIEGYAVTVGGTAGTLMGTTGATWDAVILASSVWNLRYEDALASQQVLVDGTAVVDSPGRLEIYYTADGISFESIDPASVETALYIPGMELTTIAGPNSGLGDFFHGNVAQMAFIDSSPIQDQYANDSDGVRYGALEQPVPLSNASVSIEFVYATGDQTILNGSVPVLTVVSGVLTGGVNVSNILLDGAAYVGAALTVGQHYRIAFDVDGGDIDTFGPLASGGMMANLQVEGDSSYSWDYPLVEGPTVDTGPELISGAPTLIGGSATWDGSTLHLEGTDSSGTFEGITVADGGDYHVTFDYNTSATNTYIRLGGGGNIATIPGPAVGTFDEVLNAGGTGYVLNIASDNNSGDFTNFSVKSATGGSLIHNTDPSTQGNYQNLPIYDTDALMGDNTRFIQIPEILFPASDGFRISFDWIRQETDGTSAVITLGDETGPSRMVIGDSGGDPANGVYTAQTNNAAMMNVPGIFDGVANGKHVSCEYLVQVGLAQFYIDGELKGSDNSTRSDFIVNCLMKANNAALFPAGSALQNVILENLTTGEAIGYKINEGSGLDVIAYDIVNGEFGAPVPAKNGTITPDASWEYIPEYTNNGAWTPDTDWVFVDSNTRYYPMDEGSGDTFKAYNGKGEPTPVNDATIVNYTDNWE